METHDRLRGTDPHIHNLGIKKTGDCRRAYGTVQVRFCSVSSDVGGKSRILK
jgi:hypothetical protein